MKNLLEVSFSGWTATPRMPFVLSGGAICLPVPTYSLLLGLIGCCIGRMVEPGEVAVGFHYSFDNTAKDLETRDRLAFDGKQLKPHPKGTDVYIREFHVKPTLTLWLDRLDWAAFFDSPVGTPSLGRSQDLLCIQSVREVAARPVAQGVLSGCLLPFAPQLQVGGRLAQLAEAYRDNDTIGGGRTATRIGMFVAVHWDSPAMVSLPGLYEVERDEGPLCFYLHRFHHESIVVLKM
ncbi:hypothetical protein [Chitinophaga qingshengii]|uniref:CRISPR-associated protein Cas5 n=1 Tax=Chitinophaga qingshengii TaxID=1569794 RepID=A0ABR7TQC7_9BACT|nr:hypothetical protein [Chitinophaga qingshengii]MBC9932178.1 hypothetical protein [Chitinophaga qingshengii]